MGDNEVRLVEGYLKLREELAKELDIDKSKVIKAKMEGIVFAYETYVSDHWATFDYLLKRYFRHNGII